MVTPSMLVEVSVTVRVTVMPPIASVAVQVSATVMEVIGVSHVKSADRYTFVSCVVPPASHVKVYPVLGLLGFANETVGCSAHIR